MATARLRDGDSEKFLRHRWKRPGLVYRHSVRADAARSPYIFCPFPAWRGGDAPHLRGSAMQKMPPRADAIAEFAASYRVALMNFFRRRVRSQEDAEELTQEVFVRLLRRSSLADIRHLEGFAFTTAANLLRDYYRLSARTGRTVSNDDQLHQLASEDAAPEKITEDRQQLGVLLKALEELPPRCRTVFIMHRFEDMPHSEIAQRQNISVSAVEKHIASAVLAMRKKLGRANDA